MTISVRHLGKSLAAVFALVRCLSAVHVNMVLNVIQLGVRFAAVLALKQLVGSPGAQVGLEPLDVAAVVAVGVDTLFSVYFSRVNVGLFVGNILFKVKVSFDGVLCWFPSVLRSSQWERLCVISIVNYRVHLGGHLADERHQDGLVSARDWSGLEISS